MVRHTDDVGCEGTCQSCDAEGGAKRRAVSWRLWLAAFAPLAVALSCGSDTTQPGGGPPPPPVETVLQVGHTVSGKVSGSDTVRYLFASPQSGYFVFVLQTDTGSATLAIYTDLSRPPAQTIHGHADVSHSPSYTAAAPYAAAALAYHLAVSGNGSFHVWVYTGDAVPETASLILTANDTVSNETIDVLTRRDLDEFLLIGKPGDEYDVFLQAQTGSESQVIQVQVPDGVGSDLATEGNGLDSSLTEHATGHFLLPANGMAHVRVVGKVDLNGNSGAGAYRLMAYHVNTQPEVHSAVFTLGDSVVNEKLDFPGDVDEYTLTVPTDTTVDLLVECDQRSIIFTELVGANVPAIAQTGYCEPSSANPIASGSTSVPAGTYTIRISVPDALHSGGYAGSYRLYLYPRRDAPEQASPNVFVGDTIFESLDPLGDRDIFTLHGNRLHDITIRFEGLESGWAQSMRLMAFTTTYTGAPLAIAYPPSEEGASGETGHIALPDSATVFFEIAPEDGGAGITGSGRYRVIIQRLSRAPEHHASQIAVGDTVVGEIFDGVDDVDDFTLTGTPNEEVVAFLTADAATGDAYMAILDTTTETTIKAVWAVGQTQPFGRFRLPASGVATVRLYKAVYGFPYGSMNPIQQPGGSYQFMVLAVNRAPEHRSAAITIGDTITGEDIAPVGDIDEYTFTGTAGDTLVVRFSPGLDSHPELGLDVIDLASGQLLTSYSTLDATSGLGTTGSVPFVLPATGSYLVRVRGDTDITGDGSYQFAVERVP